MSRPYLSFFLLALVSGSASCSLADFYDDKEYVIYDSTTPPTQGSPERAEEERIAAATDAVAQDAEAATVEAALERIFVLENLEDELDRALSDGVGDAAVLQRKRDDVQREIEWRRREVGEAYDAAREQRLQRLTGFPVVVR